ncbi:hypothetical protein LZ30DRAFT_107015 [Colletotrichum cereale]|nr:hypothetical protein LZ30DRAFT_107015 [Colletotrichum cereale]
MRAVLCKMSMGITSSHLTLTHLNLYSVHSCIADHFCLSLTMKHFFVFPFSLFSSSFIIRNDPHPSTQGLVKWNPQEPVTTVHDGGV